MTNSPLSYGPFISRNQAQEQGLTRFFMGKPCKQGHVNAQMTVNGQCVTCKQICRDRYKAQNREKVAAQKQRWQSRQLADPAKLERQRARKLKNQTRHSQSSDYKEKRLAYVKSKYLTDLNFKAKTNFRNRVADALKRQNSYKSSKTKDLLGCSYQELRSHLLLQFKQGMTWENHGKWHIDHIRPCASFDLTDPEQQRECFHFSNLQPLWAEDNLRKSDKWEPELAAA